SPAERGSPGGSASSPSPGGDEEGRQSLRWVGAGQIAQVSNVEPRLSQERGPGGCGRLPPLDGELPAQGQSEHVEGHRDGGARCVAVTGGVGDAEGQHAAGAQRGSDEGQQEARWGEPDGAEDRIARVEYRVDARDERNRFAGRKRDPGQVSVTSAGA